MVARSLQGVSPSTVAALRFAQASARQRHGDGSLDVEIDPLDLVFGILLAHPGSSPPERLMRHFQFTLGDIKPSGRLEANAEELNQLLRVMDADGEPSLDYEAQQAFDAAFQMRSVDDTVHLRHLWGGVINAPTGSFVDLLSSKLAQRGTTLDRVREVTQDWLKDEIGRSEAEYTELLIAELPYSPRPIEVARYNHEKGERGGDLLQLADEVDAFAYLLASVDLRPPLAIGLFGDWGSGKTFFMNSIRRRIASISSDDGVAAVPQSETRFWRHIVQIEFNAWHYSEGDLLASLVDHLFTELERETAPVTNGDESDRSSTWVEELTAVSVEEQELIGQVEQLSAEVAFASREVAALDAEAQARLDGSASEDLGELAAAVRSAVEPVLDEIEIGDHSLDELAETVAQASGELTRTRQIARALFGSRLRGAATVVAVALVPFLVFLVGRAQGWAGAAWVGTFTVLAEVAAGVGVVTTWLTRANDGLEAARAQIERQRMERRDQAMAEADARRCQLVELERELAETKRLASVAAERRRSIEGRLHEPTYQVVRRFVRERLELGTYRERLGLHAIVRNDLDRLSAYIEQENASERRNSDLRSGDYTRMFNRIVLYIDDLDRCSDEKVIEVLQAVHLLLAFDLFVVVVAVDDRWLSHALETQYPVLAEHRREGALVAGGVPTGGAGEVAATGTNTAPGPTHAIDRLVNARNDPLGPSDYLEKIFQIPFRVRPIGSDGRRRMIGGLLRDQVQADGGAGSDGERPGTVRLIENRERTVLDDVIARPSRNVHSAAEELTLTREEFDVLEAIAPLLGNTPRAVKRFVNVYQLLKMMDATPDGVRPPDYQVAALLLGLDEGSPTLAARLRGLGAGSLATVPELIEVHGTRPEWAAVDADRINAVDGLVRRFQFP